MQDPNRRLCSVCHAATTPRRCRFCHVICERRAWPGGICERCELTRQIEALRRSASTVAGAALEPFLTALLAAERPGAPLAWLFTSPAAHTMRAMLAGTVSVSHEALDDHDCGQATDCFRVRLVEHGVLHPRNEALARFDRWCEQQLATCVEFGGDHPHLAVFARWHVRPRLARRVGAGTAVANTYKHARQQVRTAIRLVQKLHGSGRDLRTVDQAFIDVWLADAPSRALATRAFLGWAREQQLIDQLDVRRAAAQSSTTAIDHEARLAHARRLIEDSSLLSSTRFAGLLLLLYGQHVTRIVALRVDDVLRHGEQTFVTLGPEPILLPDPVAAIVAEVHMRASGVWLFPGARPGTHIHAASMRRRLRSMLGVTITASRTGALLGLAAEVPAPVLAELLGYCNDTASHWRREASGDWARYAGLAAATTTIESGPTLA